MTKTSMEPGLFLRAAALLIAAGVAGLGAAGADSVGDESGRASAWREMVERRPGLADDLRIGPLERKLLDVMTPEQASAFSAGEDLESIVLASGETVADFIAFAMAGVPGLVYAAVDPCALFSTGFQTVPVSGAMAAGETREFAARTGVVTGGPGLTDQGGVAGCEVPIEAEVVVLHLRAVPTALQGANGQLKIWAADLPEPAAVVIDTEPLTDAPFMQRRWNTTAIVELCPAGTCVGGEFKVKTASLGAQVRGDLVGFFRHFSSTDLPGGTGSGLDADTVDALDSLDLALVSHTHDGGDIVSGAVGETFVDSLISRDTDIMPIILANDGAGSGLDGDFLDGLDSIDFNRQVANLLTVSPSCPTGAADALATRCWQSISAALAAINGVDLPLATAMNRYLIQVGPGVYTEQVTMKPFVDIEGAGGKVTVITNAVGATVLGASDAELRWLTVEQTGTFPAILLTGASTTLKHVTAKGMVGVEVISPANPLLVQVGADGSGGAGLVVKALAADTATVTVSDSSLTGVAGASIQAAAGGTAVVNVVGSKITGAGKAAGGGTETYSCLGAFDALFTELDTGCQ